MLVGSVVVSSQALAPGEVFQFGGEPQPSERNLAAYFARSPVAFLGTVDSVSAQLLAAPDGTPTVFTRITFRPVEFIKGSAPTGSGTFDVWRWGGSYRETPNGREPVRPVAVAQRLQPDTRYFVAVTTIPGYPSLDGRFVLNGDDT